MNDNSLIEKYKNLQKVIRLNILKKKFIKLDNNNSFCLDLLYDKIGVYNDFIGPNVSVIVGGGIKNFFSFKTGNLDEAYLNLINKVGTSCSLNISSEQELLDILNNVYTTVIDYFGYGDLDERIKYYETFEYSKEITLEGLKGKNLAVCLEDAVLSQNILKLLGFNATLKVSLVQYGNGKFDTHAYNLIKFGNKNYIFDSRFPSKSSPVVKTLTDDEYLKFVSGLDVDAKITDTDNDIIYYAANISLKQIRDEEKKAK